MSVTPISAANGPGKPARSRRPTATANFGSGRRESHDATAFYDRFGTPVLNADDAVTPVDPAQVDQIWVHDARQMPELPDNSVALVVTSPPYFAGKAYEEALGVGHVPGDYVEYLTMLHDVFAECVRVLEPGGRIAVNVANLGRKPYRSLSSDVIRILQDDLGLLLRGEIIWQKARGAGGNCAWGSFASPRNPVLRDVTERVIVASKGRFDRARTTKQRQVEGLPVKSTIGKDDFLDLTLDVWELAPESATRVGHPAPYPVALPRQLIDLYTFEGDLVLDPFMGSGTTAVAAVQSGRLFAGYDTDPDYAQAATSRIERAREDHAQLRLTQAAAPDPTLFSDFAEHDAAVGEDLVDFQRKSSVEGRRAQELAAHLLDRTGFGTTVTKKARFPAVGVEVNFEARDAERNRWLFDVSGAFSSSRPGLQRTDTLWKALGKASVLQAGHSQAGESSLRYVLLTTDVPDRGTAGYKALLAAQQHGTIWDVLLLSDPRTVVQLLTYAAGRNAEHPPNQLTAYL